MRIRSITVSSQRKLPHPNIDYANISSLVSLEAELAEEDNATACAKKLQVQADNLVEQHLEAIGERMKARRAQNATATTAANLAEKHGAKF